MASETQTPVSRSKRQDWDTERDELQELGFYQETYAALRHMFRPWNEGTQKHQWQIKTSQPCALCGSPELAVVAGSLALCLPCLDYFPHTPWHPTGVVRRKTTDFLLHAQTCTLHS